MLRRSRTLCLSLALLAALAASAHAQDDAEGLHRPERLTIGTADQFLGQIAPDDHTLYFASNRDTTTELFSQDLSAGSARLVFDEGADVTWPRVSPDGKHLLYVSYRADASGQLCVRALPKGPRQCLADPGAVQAQWVGPERILLLSRPASQGNMRVSLVTLGRRLLARALFDRNLTGPAVSPDGRWLVYTPVERYVERIGPGFAARAGRMLVAQRLDQLETEPVSLALETPGLSGQPAFSLDGRTLYFVQFISDSNHDGVIDGSDHGVLFSVPFEASRDDAPAQLVGVVPDQLTDASWNCQYPSPGSTRLMATCARAGHLDIYALPLEGMVPKDWPEARLRAELDVTTNTAQLLLLRTRLLKIERDPAERRAEMVSLVRLHLQLDEFDAAEFHARHVAALKDKTTSGLGTAMRLLCEHRRALRDRERGHLSLDFAADSQRRQEQLATGRASSPAGLAARGILRSEIADVLGDKGRAREELEAVRIEEVTMPAVLDLYADRADALYRLLDERDALVAVYRTLAEHPALSPIDRLGHARAGVRSLVRGRPADEAREVLASALATAPPDGEHAFALELAAAIHEVRGATPSPAVVDRILEIYRRQTRPERRRAVMLEAVQRGWDVGAQALTQRLAELYVDDAPRGSLERRRAARLYRRLLEDRAYTRLGAGKEAEARDDFFAVARRTGSFESWVGYIDRRIREGHRPEVLAVELAPFVGDPKGPVWRFTSAYLLVRRMPRATRLEAEQLAEQAIGLLRGGWVQLKDKPEALAVFGAVLHERFLHNGDRAAAQRASALYLIAIDLARRNPRYQAMLLEQMALLQAQVGNWRIAIDYFNQREKLPFTDSLAGVAHRLIKARTLLHLDREAEAATLADEALAVIDKSPRMEKYLPLCLDRAALYNLAADRFERALALYERALPAVERTAGSVGTRNRLVLHLTRAAAALGASRPQLALDTIAGVEQTLTAPGIGATLQWPHATVEQVTWTYRLIAAGLRAKAHRALGQDTEAARALELRGALYVAQLKRAKVDEHVRSLALVEGQLAELALEHHDGGAALGRIKAALDRIEALPRKEGEAIDRDKLDILLLAAQVRVSTEAKLKLSLRDRLTQGIAAMAAQGHPRWRRLTRWLEIYLGLLGNRGSRPKAAGTVPPASARGAP